MRSLSCLLVLGALAASSVLPQGWNSGQEYQYSYTSQVLTGIPQLDRQYAGVRLSSTVRVQAQSDSTLTIKMENTKYRTYNENLNLNNDKEAPSTGEQEIEASIKRALETPFKVYLKDGLVQKLEVESGEPEYVVNIKKGLLSQIQMDVNNARSLQANSNNNIRSSDSIVPEFKTMEDSILGECETVYTINKMAPYHALEFESDEEWKLQQEDEMDSEELMSQAELEQELQQEYSENLEDSHWKSQQKQQRLRQHQQQQQRQQQNAQERQQRRQEQQQQSNWSVENPCAGKDYYEVIKAKNLDNCRSRPSYEESVGSHKKTDRLSASSFPMHSSVSRSVICGTPQDYIIRKVTTENRIVFNAMGQFESAEKLDTSSFSTLKLESVKQVAQSLSAPSSARSYETLTYEFPSNVQNKSLRQQAADNVDADQQEMVHAPQPDMESAPQSLYPRSTSQEEWKQNAIEGFSQLVDASRNIEESSVRNKDVPSLSIRVSEALSLLSYSELKQVEQQIMSRYSGEERKVVEKALYDLISMAGTNPTVKLIKEKIMSGDMEEDTEAWSWIVSNSIRSIKTPTEQLLSELVTLVKSQNVQQSRVLNAAVVMGVTELMNKACIDEARAEIEFPIAVYGKFCDEESQVIKAELIPFLASKLRESANSDMGSVITYINALGNLGHDESAVELLKVVEGRISVNPHPRSVAVYRLIRVAKTNPSVYRPVFQSLIENSAENNEVRMAAVTAFFYTSPSSADIQRLAIRTWFEPSEQVSAYIVSTLKALKNLPEVREEYKRLGLKAQNTFQLVRPSMRGLHYSQQKLVSHFEDSLKMSAFHQRQTVSTEESILPKSIYHKTAIHGAASFVESSETAFYMQGAKTIVNQLYDLYTDLKQENLQNSQADQNRNEIRQKLQKIDIESAESIKPEAHLTVNLMGLQKLYSFDAEFVNDISRKISMEMARNRNKLQQGISLKHFKIIDLFSYQMIFPTESGMPAYLNIRNPAVSYNKVDIKSENADIMQDIAATLKTVTNYKNQIHSGVACPLTKKFYGAGVELSFHISLPVETKLSYSNGQVHLSLKTPEDNESQRERQYFIYDVRPFTAIQETSSMQPFSQSPEARTITTEARRVKKEVPMFDAVGLDMKMKVDSEHFIDYVQLYKDLKKTLPTMLTSPPFIKISPKQSTVALVYNAQNSQTKQIDLILSAASAYIKKESQNLQMQVNSFEQSQEVQRISQEASQAGISASAESISQKLQAVRSDVNQQCQQEKQQYKEKMQKLKEQQNKQKKQLQKVPEVESQGQQQEELSQSEIEKLAEERKQLCQAERQICKVEEEIYRSSNAELAQQKKEKCEARQKKVQNVRDSLKEIKQGKSWSLSLNAIMRGKQQSNDRNVEAQVTWAEKIESNKYELTKIDAKIAMKDRFDLTINADAKLRRPSSKWNKEQMLKEDLSTKATTLIRLGLDGAQPKETSINFIVYQSEEQKNYARTSEEARQCEEDEKRGVELSAPCKHARHQAASLDKVHLELSVPTEISQSPSGIMVGQAIKAYFYQHLTEKMVGNPSQPDPTKEDVDIVAAFSQNGELLSWVLTEKRIGKESTVSNVRLGRAFRDILPICTKEPMTTTILQKVTGYKAPASCVLEGGMVKTFDNLRYEYQLNDCEHIVFSDRSTKPRVAVSVKQNSAARTVIAVIDNQKYEMTLRKAGRFSRDQEATVMVNGQSLQVEMGQIVESPADDHTLITRYEDGVYAIVSKKYSVSVQADSERLEVKAHHLNLRNRAMGLCGDMNDEKTGDMKSSKMCIMSRPQLAAYSYMLTEGCQGIPSAEREEFRQEQEQCVKQEEVPTRASHIFRQKLEEISEPQQRHLVQKKQNKTCISKDQVKTCRVEADSLIKSRRVAYACKPEKQAKAWERRAERGEQIEELQALPTAFSETVYEPANC